LNRSILGRALAEAAGTALLVGIGTGAVVLAARSGGIPQWAVAGAWFLAVLVPIVLLIGESGAHLNPVVTLALAASGRIAWRELPAYVLGQFAGAFGASGLVLATLGDHAHLGSTFPAPGVGGWTFPAEFVFTAALIGSVFVLADRGEGWHRWRLALPPAVVALSTYVIGPWTGSSLNPARTIAPAVLSGTYSDLWIYLTAVPLGALAVAAFWRPRAVDRLDRGPGRLKTDR
jgi:glycerol uptake facilitator-like aquaporin